MNRRTHALRFWLIVSLMLLLLVIAIGLLANRYYVKNEIEAYAGKFALLSVLRRDALQNYFDTVSSEIHFWSLNRELLASQRKIDDLWDDYQANTGDPAAKLRELYVTNNPFPEGQRGKYQGPEEGADYLKFHRQFHPFRVLPAAG